MRAKSKVHEEWVLDRPPMRDIVRPSAAAMLGAYGYDVLELKYDGIWGTIVVTPGRIDIYSRSGQRKKAFRYDGEIEGRHVLHAEYIFASNWATTSGLKGKVLVFDCVEFKGEDVRDLPQRVRKELAAAVVDTIPGSVFIMAPGYSVQEATAIWRDWVVGKDYEGLMFKKSTSPYGEVVVRLKRAFEVDYICMGFNESDSDSFKGRMVGSIKAGLYVNGRLRHVANAAGLNNEQRTEMYNKPSNFIGRTFVAQGKKVFKTGALRHPSFSRWHPSKVARECTLEAARKVGGFTSA